MHYHGGLTGPNAHDGQILFCEQPRDGVVTQIQDAQQVVSINQGAYITLDSFKSTTLRGLAKLSVIQGIAHDHRPSMLDDLV